VAVPGRKIKVKIKVDFGEDLHYFRLSEALFLLTVTVEREGAKNAADSP
jgi:hypothetical protein